MAHREKCEDFVGGVREIQCLHGNIQYYEDYKNTSHSYTDIGEQDYENVCNFEFFKQ